jgi:hypothetical protein
MKVILYEETNEDGELISQRLSIGKDSLYSSANCGFCDGYDGAGDEPQLVNLRVFAGFMQEAYEAGLNGEVYEYSKEYIDNN